MKNKSSKADKMYANGPSLEQDDNGKPYIKKPDPTEPPAGDSEGEDDSMPMNGSAGMPASVRQAQERRDMYNRQETEHSLMDGSDKAEMVARHAKELNDMNKRHMKENNSDNS